MYDRYEMYQFVMSYHKVKLQFLSPAIMDVSFSLGEIDEKETLRWLRSQDEIISRCVHVLGFVYRKQEEKAASVVVSSSSARPVAIEHKEPQARG